MFFLCGGRKGGGVGLVSERLVWWGVIVVGVEALLCPTVYVWLQ